MLEELLREGYQGILGREPDEDSVRSHVERLRSGAALGEVLSDLAASDEHWRRQKDRHLEELLREGYQGILGREPDEDGVRSHVERLRSGATLGEVLSDLVASDEHWRNGVAQRAEQLVDELYRTLLGREADIRGIESYSEYLRSARGFEVVAASLIRSEEFYRRFTRINRNRLVKDIYSATYGVQPSQLVMTAFLEYFQAFSTDSVGQIIEAVQKLPSLSNNSANDKRGFAVVIIPNKVWLVTALSSAKQLYDNEGIKSVVLLGGMFVDETYFSRLNFVVAFCVHDDFIKNHASRFDVSIIIGHADNVDREIENLIGLFPTAQVRCFSDGYRNSAHGFGVSKFKAVDHVYYFGFLDTRKAEVRIKANSVQIVRDSTYNELDQHTVAYYLRSYIGRAEKSYSIFLLRYWGMLGYRFDREAVIASWLATVSRFSKKGETVIIKPSNTYDRSIADEFVLRLSAFGYDVAWITDYFEDRGLDSRLSGLSYEALIRQGILASPRNLYTLDGSLPSMLVISTYLCLPVNLVLGVDRFDLLNNSGGSNGVISNVQHQIECLKRLPQCSIEQLDPANPTFFSVRLPLVNKYFH